LSPCGRRGCFHASPGARLDKQRNATSTTGSANFSAKRAGFSRSRNDAIYGRRRNRGQIAPTVIPFRTQQSPSFFPIAGADTGGHFLCDRCNFLEVLENSAVAVYVSFHDSPIVDSGTPRLSGVTKDQSLFEFVNVCAELRAILAAEAV
jgi:hypothetical protein